MCAVLMDSQGSSFALLRERVSSFPKFIANIRCDAVASLTDAERGELAPVIAGQPAAVKPATVQRNFVKEWKTEDLLSALDHGSRGRN